MPDVLDVSPETTTTGVGEKATRMDPDLRRSSLRLASRRHPGSRLSANMHSPDNRIARAGRRLTAKWHSSEDWCRIQAIHRTDRRIRISARGQARQYTTSGAVRTLSLPHASTKDIPQTCEAQMSDQEYVLRSVSGVQPAAKGQRASPSNSAPPPKLVYGRIGFVGLARMGIAMATNTPRAAAR
jgi:hypothetical protein